MYKNRRLPYYLIGLVFGLLFTAFIYLNNPIRPKTIRITDVHKAIAANTEWIQSSKAPTAQDLEGRIILLDFFSYSNINSLQILPNLHYLNEKFADKLFVIGIHAGKYPHEKKKHNIANAMERIGFNFIVANDSEFKLWKNFGVQAWPSQLLISPAGEVVRSYPGEGNLDRITRDISALISSYGDKLRNRPNLYARKLRQKTKLKFPTKLVASEDLLFIADTGNNSILAVNIDNQKIQFVIGNKKATFKDGSFSEAGFNQPTGLLYRDNKIWVADTGNHSLREIDLTTKTVKTIAGTGKKGFQLKSTKVEALKHSLASPSDLAFAPAPEDHKLLIAMSGSNQIWSYDLSTQDLKHVAGNGRIQLRDGSKGRNSLAQPSGIASKSGKVFFVDSATSTLREIENGIVRTIINGDLFDFGSKDGRANVARMQNPSGLDISDKGIYIADTFNNSIRYYDFEKRELSTLNIKSLNEPSDVLIIKNKLLISNTNNHEVLIFDLEKSEVKKIL